MPARTLAAERADIAAAVKGGAFDPPADLSEHGAQLWREAMQVHPGSFWKPPYLLFLRQYVAAVLACDRLDKEIVDEGEVCQGAKGGSYVNPRVFVRDRERSQVVRLARMLGITPDTGGAHPSAENTAAQLRAGERAGRVADAMAESQGLIPGLDVETVQ